MWHYELLSYYQTIIKISHDGFITNEIKKLELNGFHTLHSLVQSLIPQNEPKQILPFEKSRYSRSRTVSIGMSSQQSKQWNCIRLLVFFHQAAIPISLPSNYIYIDKEKWEAIFNNAFIAYPMLILSFLYQFIRRKRNIDPEHEMALFQRILYEKGIAIEAKRIIFDILKDLYDWHKNQDYVFYFFILVLPYFSRILSPSIWEPIIIDIWTNDKDVYHENILWQDLPKSSQAIEKTISAICNIDLLLTILSKSLNETDNRKISKACDYMAAVINNTLSHEIIIEKKIVEGFIETIIRKEDVTMYDLRKVCILEQFITDSDKIIFVLEKVKSNNIDNFRPRAIAK